MIIAKQNIIVETVSLRKVEIRHVNLNDMIVFQNILKGKLSDIEQVIKILSYQISSPRVGFDVLRKLPDEELEKILKSFVENEEYLSTQFRYTGNYIKDFKQAIISSNEKLTDDFQKALEPVLKSSQNIISAFDLKYASIIKQTIEGESYIHECISKLASISSQFNTFQISIVKSFQPMIESFQTAANIIAKSIIPNLDIFQKWIDTNGQVFDRFSKYWLQVQQQYKIDEQKSIKILRRYKWFITPSLPKTFVFKIITLKRKKGRQDRFVNELFIKHFKKNNWNNLDIMVAKWRDIPLLKKRYKILSDSVKIVKSASKNRLNATNIVLPSLISQIDGMLTDYLSSKGFKWECEYDDVVDKRNGKVKKIGRKTRFMTSRQQIATSPLDDLANDIFLNVLFQKAQRGKPLETPFNFNRHKIIHGENTNYGRRDYLIRAYMVLDFLAHLK